MSSGLWILKRTQQNTKADAASRLLDRPAPRDPGC